MKALVVLAALGLGGCLFDEVRGIPCASDGECPSTYFCDIPRSECRAKTDTDGIPNVTIPKVKDATGQLVLLPKVPAAATTPIGLQLVNDGAGPADDFGLTFAPLACVDFDVHDDTLPSSLSKGQTAIVTVDAKTSDAPECASVKIVDWFLTFSGRDQRGTFDLDITAPGTGPGGGGEG